MPFFLLFLNSCIFSGFNNVPLETGGNAKTFVENGFSLPVFDEPSFQGYAVSDNNIPMLQVSEPCTLTVPVVNPGKLTLTWNISTDTFSCFSNTDNALLVTGRSSKTHFDMKLDFTLLETADKKDVKFLLDMSSTMRPYDTPVIGVVRINTKPSPLVPLKDEFGTKIENNTWEPVIADNKATIYWDFIKSITDTDITTLHITYTTGGIRKKVELPYNAETNQFGENKYSVDGIEQGKNITFTFRVFDDESLGSNIIGSGDLTVYKSSEPVFTRGENEDINKVTITAPVKSTLYVSADAGSFELVKSPYTFELVTSHTLTAYTKTSGKIDSDHIIREYNAEYFSNSITFSAEDFQTLVFEKPASITKGTAYTFTPADGALKTNGSQWQWYVGNELVTAAKTDTLTYTFNESGNYTLSVLVTFEGIMYSGTVSITVVE